MCSDVTITDGVGAILVFTTGKDVYRVTDEALLAETT